MGSTGFGAVGHPLPAGADTCNRALALESQPARDHVGAVYHYARLSRSFYCQRLLVPGTRI